MALVIPDIQSITNGSTGLDFQSVADSTDWAAREAAADGSAYVISGMTVTQHTGSDMEVSIASGSYAINGVVYTYAGGTATIAAADSTDRRDLVSINAAGTVTVTKGTDCGTAGWTRSSASTALPPVKPAIPSANCLLGEVGVTSTTTAITTAVNIVDKTCLDVNGNYYAAALTTAVTLTTATTGQTAVMTTGTLAVGTWQVAAQMGVLFGTGTTATGSIVFVSAGTAGVTFAGPTSSEIAKAIASEYGGASVDCVAIVTSPGTLIMYGSGATAATAITQDYGHKGNPTGIVCVRIG